MILNALAILVAICVLIVVHEYGHYRVARACGVKVLRFSVGFGRVLWSHRGQGGTTEFVICAVPLGGYVRMLDEREAPVAPAERNEAFNNRPVWQRLLIVSAGPLANLALAVLLFAGAQWHGLEEPAAVLSTPAAGSLMAEAGVLAGDRVLATRAGRAGEDGTDGDEGAWHDVRGLGDLHWAITQALLDHQPLRLRVTGAGGRGAHDLTLPLESLDARALDGPTLARIGLGAPFARPVLGEMVAGGPAQRAGLRSGDEVLAVDGQPVADAAALLERIRGSAKRGSPGPMEWIVRRGGESMNIVVQPRAQRDGERSVGKIDAHLGAPGERVLVRDDLIDALRVGLERTWGTSSLTLRMMGRMLVGQASVKNLSGPLTIADVAGQSAHRGLSDYLAFLAMVSVSLGVLNLLPLPVLDGGHLIYYLFEGATGRPVSELWLAWLQRGGIVILLLLMSLALSNDVVRFLGR